MTTIALKDNILAADTQLTVDDTKILSDDKITILNKHTIFAGSGETRAIHIAQKFFALDDWRNRERPEIAKEKDEDNPLDAILIFKGQAFIVDRYLLPDLVKHPFIAVGSGWKFAMAGMQQGMSAIDAVEFASQFDLYTNNKVRWLNVKEFEENSKTKSRRSKGKTRMEPEEEGDRKDSV